MLHVHLYVILQSNDGLIRTLGIRVLTVVCGQSCD
jgi:hypothetical protein